MRKVVFGLVGLVFVVVAAVLLIPSLVDLRSLVAPALQSAKESTGRDIRVGGIGLSLFPSPTATVSDIRVANVPGAVDPDMLRIKAVEVRVALLPLLSSRVEVRSVTIVDPVVTIETTKDGKSSLDFPPAKPGAAGTTPMDIALENVTLKNGTVLMRDAAGGQRKIDQINLTGSAGSMIGPVLAKGTARAFGISSNVELTMAKIEAGKPAAMKFALDGAGARLAFDGTITGAPQAGLPPALAGKLAAKVANLGEFAKAANAGGGNLPAMNAEPFSFDANVTGTTAQVAAREIQIALGDARGAGALAAAFGEKTTVQLALNLGKIDLDKLLAQGGGAAPAAKPAATPAVAGAGIPPNLVAAIDVGVEGIVYRGQQMQKAKLLVDVVNGAAVVKQLSAVLPANSDVRISNLPLPLGGKPPAMPDGRIEASSGNLRGLLEWLGADLSQIPTGRLTKMDLKASVKSDGDSVQVSNLDAGVDQSRLTGGFTMGWSARPTLAVRANVDRVNIDSYMPQIGAAGQGAPKRTQVAQAAGGTATSASGAGSADTLKLLESFDLNLQAEMGSVTYRNTPVQGLKMTVELVNGKLTIREATIADLAGAQAAFTLVLDKLATAPAYSTAFNLRATDAKRFLKFASGFDTPLTAQQLGQLTAKGTVAGTVDGMKVDTTVEGFGGGAKLAGSIEQMTQPVPKVDMTIDASFPEFGPVLGALAGEQAKQGSQKLGPFAMKGRIANSGPDTIAFRQTEIRAFGGDLDIDGTIAQLSSATPAVDLTMALKVPSLRPLLTAFNPDPQLMASADKLGGIDFKGKAVGNSKKVTLRDAALTGLGGSIKLNGDVIDAGKQLDLTADMQNFVLGPFLAALPGVITAQGAQQLGPVNGKLAMKGGQDNMTVGFQNVAMQGFGGTMALNGTVNDALDTTRTADLTFDIANLAVGPMLAAFPNANVSPALAQNLQNLTAKGSIKGSTDAPSVTLQQGTAQAFGGTVSLVGTVSEPMTPRAKYDMTASAKLPNLMQVLNAFYKPAGQIPGPVEFDNVKLVGDGKRVQITNLNGRLGNIGVNGTGSMVFEGQRPRLDLQINTTGDINLDAFQSAEGQKRGDLRPYWERLFPELMPASLRDSQVAQARPLSPRWSKEPLPILQTIRTYDARVAMQGQALVDGPYRIVNPHLVLASTNGVATLERLSGSLYDGQITILGKVDATAPVPTASMQMQVRQLDIAKAAAAAKAHQTGRKWFLAFGRVELIEGKFDADLNYGASGRSEAEMVQSLAGSGGFQATNGVIDGIDVARLSNTMKNLDNIVDIAGILNQTTSGGRTRFQLINSSNTGKGGLVSSGNLLIRADAMEGKGGYNLDFPSYTMNARVDVFLIEHQKTPPIILTAVGPMDSPTAQVDSSAVQQHVLGNATKFLIRKLDPNAAGGGVQDVLKGVLGGGQQQAPVPAPVPQQAPAQQQQLNPQQLLQQLLKPKQ